MRKWLGLLLMTMCVVALGCGPSRQQQGETGPPAGTDPPLETIKASLEAISAEGQFGSEIGVMFGAIEQLKKTDASKWQAFHDDVNAMMKLAPQQRKAKAQELLDQLSSPEVGAGDSEAADSEAGDSEAADSEAAAE